MPNVKIFKESQLDKEEYQHALGYLCIERNYYYIFTKHYDLKTFPLFYLDRFTGWGFSDGPQPLLNIHDGLAGLLDSDVRREEIFPLNNLKEVLAKLFSEGKKVLVNFWTKNKMGTPFVTSLMLEGMENNTVYFTKINEDNNAICHPIDFEELVNNIDIEVPGEIELTIIKKSSLIEKLSKLDPVEAFQFIFKELYKYQLEGERLYKNGKEIKIKSNGIDELVDSFSKSYSRLVENGTISKPNQFKLNKHIHNRFQPIQYYLKFILNNSDFSNKISTNLKEEIDTAYNNMDFSMNNLLKFASLFVIKPNEKSFELYLNALKQLGKVLPHYQETQLQILKELV